MKTKTTLLLVFFITLVSFAQTSIYLEEFSLNNRGVRNDGSINLNGVDWDINVDNVSTPYANRFRFRTVSNNGGDFLARRVSNGADWISPIIDISNDADVSFTIDISQETGTLEANDIVTTTYSIDSGPFLTATTNGVIGGTIAPGTIVSQTALNGATLQIKVTFISNNNDDRQQMDNVSVLGFPKTYTFDGSSWLPSDPNGNATNENRGEILVTAGDATISADTNINTVIVNPGTSLTIDSGATLTIGDVTNGLSLESSSASYSSLIKDGDIVGTINYKRHVNIRGSAAAAGNDLIALPLIPSRGLTFNTFIGLGTPTNATKLASNRAFYAFAPYNNATLAYENFLVVATDVLIKGKGYRAATTLADELLTFSGAVEPNNVSIEISNPTGGSQWNLVGNPYPSYLSSSEFLSANAAVLDDTAEAIYGYNSNTYTGDADTTGNFTIINNATIGAFPGENFNIAPGQGFLVAANATADFTGNVVFNNGSLGTTDMRTLIGDDDFIEGRTPINYNLKLDLIASNTSRTSFYFNENSSLGLDPGYDAAVYGANGNDFPIYSHLVENNTGRAMALQALNTSDLNNLTISLGVNANQGEQLRFTISDASLPSTVSVYLEDTITNTATLLTVSDYVLTPATDLNGTGRFFLKFSDSALSHTESDFDAIKIYTKKAPRAIYVQGVLNLDTTAKLYNINGRLLYNAALDSTSLRNQINASYLSDGVYILTLNNGLHQTSQKVILR